ncbi:NrfD/PsrC family molybdoenzyme membrane anchor subunit [Sporomusa termitida]|uniref:Cytochrome c nitrite reductase, NrfD subunit n=1 Tax=Sporomusa termitida TaxID=2377 RepID=A0A517E1V6_9FIRM|nr:NrfD/PsrC family molybdoenzyme membrane anchor subunit [Sporomusa termitida]QDR83486.1 cytochrome c nitrite reductase, NrfD subunit [Sporomusa termitida]
MSHNHNSWGWMLALDFFFGGMGASMLVIAGIADLFLGAGKTSLLGDFMGPVFVACGAGLLTFELGRPFQAWRVFVNSQAMLTKGAWTMTLCIVFGFAYFGIEFLPIAPGLISAYFGIEILPIVSGFASASFGIETLPWRGLAALRQVLAVLCIITGLVVAIYPGILLGRLKSCPLWNGPGLMALFLLSSLATGIAAHIVCGLILPAVANGVLERLPLLLAALLFSQFILWAAYIWIKITGTTEQEAEAARRWTRGGRYAALFKIGFMLFGTVLPLILFFFANPIAEAVAALLVIFGGAIMRNLVLYSGQDGTGAPAILGPVLTNVRTE